MKKITSLLTSTFVFLTLFATDASAQLTNPAVKGPLGDDDVAAASGASFASYFITLWNAVISIGGLLVILNFLWGSIQWISAGGDASKIEAARNKITQSIIGLIILVSSLVILGFISQLLFGDDFQILNFSFTTLSGGSK